MGRTPEHGPDGAIHHGIQTRLAILVLVAALAPMALASWVSLDGLGAMRGTLVRERQALVDCAARAIERGVRDMLEALAAVPAPADGSARARAAQGDALRAAVRRAHLLAAAVVVDGDGEVVAEVSALRRPAPLVVSRREDVREAIRTGKTLVRRDGAARSAASRLLVIVPLRDPSGATTGAAVGVAETTSPAWLALLTTGSLGPHARVCIVDEGRQVLVGLDPDTPAADEVVVRSRLTILPWSVVLAEPRAEVFGGIVALQRRWMVLAPVLAILVAVFAWGVARSVKRPLAALEVEAARIAEGDLTHPVPPLGGDEIGRLGRSFEAMREALARDELRGKLLRRVIGAQEEERKRIARELHDETCQTITALQLKLEEAGQADSKDLRVERLVDAQGMATRIIDELHRIIYDLRPSILDDLGLLPAIRWMAQRNLAPLGIQVRFEFEALPERLPNEVEITVFRAVQEAISNVVRHAEAEKVLIEVAAERGILEIDVEDDGRGFDPAEAAGPSESGRGLGILGLRERLELIGGTAKVVSSPGGGTRVSLRVPLPGEG
jgi:signal transduction histidine kinase